MIGKGRDPDLTVIGYAMWGAAGRDGPSCVASMRACASAAATSALWDGTSGKYLNAFRVFARQWWEGDTFLPMLAAPVVEECRAVFDALGFRHGPKGDDLPILINLAPADRPGREADLEATMVAGLTRELGELPPDSVVAAGGRAGVPQLLARARALDAPACIILGVESFLRQTVVDAYNRKGRLLTDANSSGFIPGEAAAAVLVARGRRPGLLLTGMGLGLETSGDGGSKEAPVTGTGLTDAMRAALQHAKTELYDINLSMGDMNGEHFKFKEHAFAVMRLDRVPPEGQTRRPRGHIEHWNVAETLGEVGAAMMPAALGWAFEAGRSRFLPGNVMFSAGEDDGRRAAVVGTWFDG